MNYQFIMEKKKIMVYTSQKKIKIKKRREK